jgi:hypothetical protein
MYLRTELSEHTSLSNEFNNKTVEAMMRTIKRLSTVAAIALVAALMFGNAAGTNAQPRSARQSRGHVVRTLPRNHVTIKVGATPYHYHEGVFYRPGPAGSVVVRAPRGAVVPFLPRSHVTIQVGGRFYYYFEGTYFIHIEEGYEVVETPAGATVDMLPVGYETAYVDGEAFYVHDDAWYRYDPGRDVYVVVEEP